MGNRHYLYPVISNFAVPNFGKIELPLLDIKKSPHLCIWKNIKNMRAIVKHQKKVFMWDKVKELNRKGFNKSQISIELGRVC